MGRLTCGILILCLFSVFSFGQQTASAPATKNSPIKKLRRVALLGETFFRHGATPSGIVPLKDGRRVLVSASDGAVRLWDISSGRELRRFVHPKIQYVWSICMLPGEKEFLSSDGKGNILRWNLTDGKILNSYSQKKTVFRLALDPSGQRFAAACTDKRCVLLDIKTGAEILNLGGHADSVYTAQFSRDGKTVMTGSNETLRFFDSKTGKVTFKTSFTYKEDKKTEKEDIYTLLLSPEGGQLVVCSSEAVRLLDVKTRTIIWKNTVCDGSKSAAFSPDGSMVVFPGHDEKLRLLNADDGVEKWCAELPGESHWCVAFSADGKEVLCNADNLICRFDTATGRRVFPKEGALLQSYPVYCAMPVPGTELVADCSCEKGLYLRDRRTGQVKSILAEKQGVKQIDISSNGRFALVDWEGWDEKPSLLDIRTGKILVNFEQKSVSNILFMPDGKHVLLSGDGGVIMWRIDGKYVRSFNIMRDDGLENVSESVSYLGVSPCGDMLIACGRKGIIWIWNVDTGTLLETIRQSGRQRQYSACEFVGNKTGGILAIVDKQVFYLRRPTQANSGWTREEILALVRQLDEKQYRRREDATKKLAEGGPDVLAVLKTIKSNNPEVALRLQFVRQQIAKKLTGYKMSDVLECRDELADFLAVHPDGQHWAVIEGKYAHARILIGRIKDDKLVAIRRIEDENMPYSVRFGRDGMLYVGNRNGTVSIYSDR